MSTVALARLRTHQKLTEMERISRRSSAEMMSAFEGGNNDNVALQALRYCEWLAEVSEDLGDLPAVEENDEFSEIIILELMRSVAIAVHAYTMTKYQAGRLAALSGDAELILFAIKRVERRYRDLLMDTRIAAENSSASLLQNVLVSTIETAMSDLGFIAHGMGGQHDTAKSTNLAAVRIGMIARRYAMLSAACLHLLHRLTSKRKATGLRQVAEGRTKLARNSREMRAALTAVRDPSVGDEIRLSARCESIAWVDIGDGFTSIIVAAADVAELRLPRRNAMRAGVAEGSWLYVKGQVREDDGDRILEIDLLPTTTHAADIWEDYLVTQVRPVYDLAPRSIDMSWEFPDMHKVGAHNDLYGRL